MLLSKDQGVNTLSPGPTHTQGLVDLAGPDPAQQLGLVDYLTTQIPIGRMGVPEDTLNPGQS
jgi:NAD(P)-dependent dehydrogenase (short-subunit alcohol dehydrogenase family)